MARTHLDITVRYLTLQYGYIVLCNLLNFFSFNIEFLSVGIPSIGRKTKSYLKKTLTSILGAVNEDERKNITCVVFLADFDSNIKQKILSEIEIEFEKYIRSGTLQVIQAPSDYYEALQHLHRSLGKENAL